MQHPDNHPRDHGSKDPGIDGLNTNHALNVIGFQYRRVGRGQDPFGSQPEVNRKVHDRIANEARKRRHAFIFARQTQRNGDTEHYRQEAKGKRADLAHPDEDRLKYRISEERDQGNDVVAA